MKRLDNKSTFSRIVKWLPAVIVLALVLMPLVAHAQEPAPQPTLRRGPHPIIGFGIMFVMLVVVMFISLLPSKRSHQD